MLLVSNLGSTLLSFLLSILIGHALGETGLGVYAAALAWILPLSLLAEFGIGTLITREIAAQPHQAQVYLTASAQIRMIFGGSLAAALIMFAPLLSDNPDVINGLRLSAPLIWIAPTFGAYTAVFRARGKMSIIAALNIGMLAAQVALTAAVFVSGAGVLIALVINTATSAGQLAAAWGLWHWRIAVGTSVLQAGLNLNARVLLKAAAPFALAAVIAAAQARLGMVILEAYHGTGAVGYYSAANRFVEAGRMIPNALFGALFPLLAALSTEQTRMNTLFRRSLLLLTGYAILLGAGVRAAATLLITLTFGAEFLPSVPLLIVLTWGLLPGLVRSGTTLYWYARQRAGFTNQIALLSLGIQVTFSLLLIPTFGALGAAYALIAAECCALLLFFILGRLKR